MTSSPTFQRVLGFDFGTRRIGVASGQAVTATASPLAPVPARDGIPAWEQLDALVAEWRPDALIVGLPLNMDDSESELSRLARKFGRRLGARFPPYFDANSAQGVPWGTITFTFTDCTHGHVAWTATDPSFTSAGSMDIQRLTQILGTSCP